MSNIYAPTDPKVLHAQIVSLLGINVTNLKKHRDFLYNNAEVIEKHFDMSTFCQLAYSTEELFETAEMYDELTIIQTLGLDIGCGSSMCVLGWVPSNPELKKQVDAIIEDGDNNWDYVAELFINRDRNINLFDYLFGQHWTDSVDYAVERMDIVIEAASSPSYAAAVLLAALANSEDEQEDRDTSEIDYLWQLEEWKWIHSAVLDLNARALNSPNVCNF